MDINYKISTAYEAAGVDSAIAGFERERGVAKALGQDFAELTRKIELLKKAKQEYEDSAKQLTKTEAGVVEVTKDDIKAAEKAAEGTSKLEIGKRELMESLRGLTRQFPLLGEAIRMVFNPLAIIIASPILAFEIFSRRVKAAVADLSEVEMPDFKLDGINAAVKAWDGLAVAKANANAAFDAGEEVYKREVQYIKDQLELQKKSLEAQKTAALARLEENKGSMSEDTYKAARKQIEEIFGDKESANDARARRSELAAKYDEAESLDVESKNKAAAADAIKLPDDKAIGIGQEARKARKQALDDEIVQRRKQQKFLDEVENGTGNVLDDQANRWKFYSTYGKGATIAGARAQEKTAEDSASEQARAVQADIDRVEALKKERDRLQEESSTAAGRRQTIIRELPGDRADAGDKDKNDAQVERYRDEIPKKISAVNLSLNQALSAVLGGMDDVHSTLQTHQWHIAQVETQAKSAIQAAQRALDRGANP